MNLRKIYAQWRTAKLLASSEKEQLRLIRAQIKLNPELEDVLLLAGAFRLMGIWAHQFKPAKSAEERERERIKREQRNQAFKRFAQEDEIKTAKAENFDRIVEMLDHKRVIYGGGSKILGDCTKADLLRAAVEADAKAHDATIEAGFYRLLAGMIGKGTVREAANRGQIIALLTTTFKEAA